MTYEQLQHLKPSAFKRRCGVHPATFEQMVEVLRPHLDRRGKQGGQCQLSVADPLLNWVRIHSSPVVKGVKIFRKGLLAHWAQVALMAVRHLAMFLGLRMSAKPTFHRELRG